MRALLALAAIVLPLKALASDPEAGLQLARDFCAFCHVVEEGGRGSDAVPSFPAIARDAGPNIESLRRFTMAPHPQMPQFADLSEEQIENLMAYFKSLQK